MSEGERAGARALATRALGLGRALAASMRGRARARGTRGALFAILALVVGPWLALFVASCFVALPPGLGPGETAGTSLVLFDREGHPLREVRADDGLRARWVRLDEVSPEVVGALVAAEDERFFTHPGVDPIAVLRAMGSNLVAGRVVSGASTLTQQLARSLVPRPRTARGKLAEMTLALRLERSLDKRTILEHYLNRTSFGPGLRGIEAASRVYFDKAASELSTAEAALLVGVARGPAVYDPVRRPERARARRDWVLRRMHTTGRLGAEALERALGEPVALARAGTTGRPSAAHLASALARGNLTLNGAALAPDAAPPYRSLTLSLDARLQRELEVATRATVASLAPRHVTAAAVVVLDNASGEVLAWVGSPDALDASRLGANDGVLQRRSPGSALKPFLYSLGIERAGLEPSTLLYDVERRFETPSGPFVPHDYDRRFRGPVLLRDALGSSLNVPAVQATELVGAQTLLDRLRALGLSTLDRPASAYGLGLALGDGEVRLVDLARAYATLARGGLDRPLVVVTHATRRDGSVVEVPRPPPTRVIDETAARLVLDVLADPKARIGAFGAGSALELPFPAAVKTGTSKGHRDNVAVGVTTEITAAVWVGNFDGSPMHGTSGLTGAAPLLREALMAASRDRPAKPFPTLGAQVERTEVCTLSGLAPTSVCPHRRSELRPRGRAPLASCDMHERIFVDEEGHEAAPDCGGATAKLIERFPPELVAWAKSSGRLTELSPSTRCPPPKRAPEGRARITHPLDGAVFALDPSLGSAQRITPRAALPEGATPRWSLDGRPLVGSRPVVPLVPGEHELVLEVGEVRDRARFRVE
jgi:penicillin-binding protein 1C